ncbi:efflux RND transporter permease subunit [Alteriqipengyuania lutimaris]|uniref:AcrB/AcrD/AcrF family protein n=1 Tax=Alteriqipengyuania lutimaris TaxID=1538146 RepID=A0A395LIH0_9SPHN|nr:efflux RND transporter permease subunit [Alteriqipengyuania lutimaris]MBB3034317.1 multidrug efflux pump subunit AcrB [Alteriqipengyuania lutimaris]RDS76778.1 AcrB/AcrD/AcrF family protein [Alteriqipengyuania lutimaris]
MDFRNISAWSIRNPVIPLVLFTALLFAGLLSFRTMDVVNNPEVEFPAVNVSISQPGAAPTEIENQITQLVESAVRSINGVKTINSTASEGSSSTFIEFEIGTDPDDAVSEVTNAIDTIRGSLPDGILEPRVSKEEISGGFLGIYAVEADDMTLEQLSWFIDDVVAKRLLGVEGMAEVNRFAGVDREIEVILDPQRIQSYGVTASQLNQVLRQNNLNAAGGAAEVGGTRQSVRVLGNSQDAYALSQQQIQLGDGRTIKLADVATVRDGYSEQTSISKVRDKEVVNFAMSRAKGASDVSTFEGALEEIAEIEAENPGVRFIQLTDSVKYTEEQYESSMAMMIEGALLAVVVVFFFLRDWRATFISSVAIPLSAIPTFWFMDLLGFNLNSLSLLALALVAGVLVDDAIVEIENIVRHMRMGKNAYQASIDAADEIGLPVVATSFCIVAVFLPVGLMPGISGQFFKNFGITVVIAVLMSLAVARLITPMLAAYFLEAKGHAEHGEGPMMDRYMRILHWSLERGKMRRRRDGIEPPKKRFVYLPMLLMTVLLLIGATGFVFFTANGMLAGLGLADAAGSAVASSPESIAGTFYNRIVAIVQMVVAGILAFAAGWIVLKLLGMGAALFGRRMRDVWRYLEARFYDHRVWMLMIGYFALLLTVQLFMSVPTQFQPLTDSDNSQVQIEMVPGTTLEDTEQVADRVAAMLYEQPEVERALERVRMGNATLYVTLSPDRERTSFQFERQLAPELAKIPDARVRFQSQGGGGGGSGRDITVMLAGSDPELLQDTASQLVEQMKGLDTLVAPRIDADLSRPELIIEPRPDIAADLGVSTASLSQTIRIATLGEIEQNAAKFSLSDRQIPIRVKLPETSRESLTTIENLPVPTLGGGTVPLSRVADIRFGSGPTAIQRYNQSRRILVGADLAEGVVSGTAREQIDALPALQDLPQGVTRDAVGEEQWQQELVTSLMYAVISGVLLVFAVLVLLYKRLMSPLVNMTSLALAPLGGIFLVWLVGQPQSMPVYIGVLLLLGIVSKNSILLIDFAIEAMADGREKMEAIIDAGHKRAQPIVMTTFAMTAGMIPTALSGVLGSGDGAWRAPMGTMVIGGLVVSTLLTLLIVPAGFSLADGFEKRVGPWLRDRVLSYRPGDERDGRHRRAGGAEPEPAE